MTQTVYLLFLVAIIVNLATAYEDDDDNPDYEHIREQFMNLQAAQRNIIKKADNVQAPVPLSQSQIQKTLGELKQGGKFFIAVVIYETSGKIDNGDKRQLIISEYSRVENWPTPSKRLGAISAVSLDVYKNVVVFHRAERVWNSETFDGTTNMYRHRNLGPIKDNTIISFDRENGNVVNEWGSNLFYMPHGLHINGNYYYVTDVALHQVFRFNIKNSTTKPELTLGEAFKPGKSSKLFCKPTSVVSLENGDFFVADGYCNTRIIKFNFNGEKILEWGKNSFSGYNLQSVEPPNAFAVPHALTLIPDKECVCVADRENGRVQCFSWYDGKFHAQYHSPIVGDRLFSVDYANGSLFVVNGPENRNGVEIRGFTFDVNTGDVTSKFGSFVDPHDIAVTTDAREIYVADLSEDKSGHRIHKFMLNGMKPTTTSGDSSSTSASKTKVHRGDTVLLVGSIVLLFTVFTVGITVLISRKKKRGNKIFVKPWDKTSKNIFYDSYNQFEKVPQNDDFTSESQNEFA